jgi:hypothetical protein
MIILKKKHNPHFRSYSCMPQEIGKLINQKRIVALITPWQSSTRYKCTKMKSPRTWVHSCRDLPTKSGEGKRKKSFRLDFIRPREKVDNSIQHQISSRVLKRMEKRILQQRSALAEFSELKGTETPLL